MIRTLILAAALCACAVVDAQTGAPTRTYRVVAEHPHDTSAFTEGLVYMDGHLYESTGLAGQSSLREVDVATGKVLRLRPVQRPYYGEGLARVGHRWLQLTWTTQVGFIYNDALQPVGRFSYRGEGWGLTSDGRTLILSDGSAVLRRLDPQSFAEVGRIEVHDGDHPVVMLNELEFTEGRIYANVWMTDRIAEIDPASGAVLAWIDLVPLRDRFSPPPDWDVRENVPNGIAYDPRSRHFFVTGKRWPKLFEIALGEIAR
jgi:glutaminyl-peptide cyclotransferase